MNRFGRGRALDNLSLGGMMPISVYRGTPQARGDANGTIFDERLVSIEERIYERSVPNHPLLDVVNFRTSDAPGIEATRYYEGEARASFKTMGPRSADFDLADTKGQPITIPVEWYYSGYEMYRREVLAANLANTQEVPRKAKAVTNAYRDLLVSHFLLGDLDSNIKGLLNHDHIKNRKRLKDADRLSNTSTAQELYDLLVDFAHSIEDTSEDIYGGEGGYAMALPSQLYRRVCRTYFGNDANITVKQRVEDATGFTLVPINRLNKVDRALLGEGTGDTAAAMCGKFTPTTHAKVLVQEFNQLPAHTDTAGLRTVTPVETCIGGIHLFEPLSFAVRTNIWATV